MTRFFLDPKIIIPFNEQVLSGNKRTSNTMTLSNRQEDDVNEVIPSFSELIFRLRLDSRHSKYGDHTFKFDCNSPEGIIRNSKYIPLSIQHEASFRDVFMYKEGLYTTKVDISVLIKKAHAEIAKILTKELGWKVDTTEVPMYITTSFKKMAEDTPHNAIDFIIKLTDDRLTNLRGLFWFRRDLLDPTNQERKSFFLLKMGLEEFPRKEELLEYFKLPKI